MVHMRLKHIAGRVASLAMFGSCEGGRHYSILSIKPLESHGRTWLTILQSAKPRLAALLTLRTEIKSHIKPEILSPASSSQHDCTSDSRISHFGRRVAEHRCVLSSITTTAVSRSLVHTSWLRDLVLRYLQPQFSKSTAMEQAVCLFVITSQKPQANVQPWLASLPRLNLRIER